MCTTDRCSALDLVFLGKLPKLEHNMAAPSSICVSTVPQCLQYMYMAHLSVYHVGTQAACISAEQAIELLFGKWNNVKVPALTP